MYEDVNQMGDILDSFSRHSFTSNRRLGIQKMLGIHLKFFFSFSKTFYVRWSNFHIAQCQVLGRVGGGGIRKWKSLVFFTSDWTTKRLLYCKPIKCLANCAHYELYLNCFDPVFNSQLRKFAMKLWHPWPMMNILKKNIFLRDTNSDSNR